MANDSPKMLGTLIIIVMKAKNLPNLVKIGKQNPFTTVTYGGIKKKTTTIDRGGQAPEWDEEFRFEIPEDMEGIDLIPDGAAINKLGGVLPLPSPTASSSSGQNNNEGVGVVGKIKVLPPSNSKLLIGLKHFRLACYADDPKDPKMIGEIMIELEPIIKKGTSDQWWELQKKARYAGEIFLEMTFYSNAEPPAATFKQKKNKLTSSISYGGPGGRVDDERADLDDFGGIDQWERDERAGGVSSRASHLSAINSSNDFASDYPDPDLAPLARSMSSLSMGGGGALPPIPQHYAYEQPQYHQQQQQSPLELHYDQYSLPPPPPPQQQQQPYENRRASYSFQSSLPSLPPIHSDRRTSYSHVQPLPEPPYNNRRTSHSSSPAPPPAILVYATTGPSEFERLAEAHYANEAYINNQVYSTAPPPLPPLQPQYISPEQWQHSNPPPPTPPQSYLPPPAPPPLPQPPTHPQWTTYQQQQQPQYGGFTPPPSIPSEAFTPPPPPPPALSSSIGYYSTAGGTVRGPPPPPPLPPIPPTPSQLGYYPQQYSHPLPSPHPIPIPPPPRFPTEPPRNPIYSQQQQQQQSTPQTYIPPAIPPAGSWNNIPNPSSVVPSMIIRPISSQSVYYPPPPPPLQELPPPPPHQYSQIIPPPHQQEQQNHSYYQNQPPPLPTQQIPQPLPQPPQQHYHTYPQPPPSLQQQQQQQHQQQVPQHQHQQQQQQQQQQQSDYLSSYNPYST